MKCLIENMEVNYPCSTACNMYGDCMAAFLEARKQRVKTNADRIRAMSDEELANMTLGCIEPLGTSALFATLNTGITFIFIKGSPLLSKEKFHSHIVLTAEQS